MLLMSLAKYVFFFRLKFDLSKLALIIIYILLLTHLLCPRHDNGRGIKCYPCPSVRTYVRLSKRCQLSKSNTFDQDFMKLGHIVEYHDVFFKFDNGPYRTMLSVVMALCL